MRLGIYTHIVFDIDGTLMDSENAILYSLRDVVRETLGRDIPLADLGFSVGVTSEDALGILGIPCLDEVKALMRDKFAVYLQDVTAFDGIPEVLEQLSGLPVTLGIVTSKTRQEYADEFAPLGLTHYFDIAVCADDAPRHKPHPDPMFRWMELSGADSAGILYIGDTENDRRCAQSAGVDFALALWGCQNPKGMEATHYLSHPRGIVDLLRLPGG